MCWPEDSLLPCRWCSQRHTHTRTHWAHTERGKQRERERPTGQADRLVVSNQNDSSTGNSSTSAFTHTYSRYLSLSPPLFAHPPTWCIRPERLFSLTIFDFSLGYLRYSTIMNSRILLYVCVRICVCVCVDIYVWYTQKKTETRKYMPVCVFVYLCVCLWVSRIRIFDFSLDDLHISVTFQMYFYILCIFT